MILDESLEPLESPEIIPSLLETPMTLPEVGQELLEVLRELELTIDEATRLNSRV